LTVQVDPPIPVVTKKSAVIKRTVKVTAYSALGYGLAGTAFAVTGLSASLHLPDWVTAGAGFVAAGIASGIHKGINWNAAGVSVPDVPATATLPVIKP
jgi:hypothetical protein